MSQKALKRKIRRGTEDSDSDFKLPGHYTKKDSLNALDEGSVKTRQNLNGSNNESDSDDNVALKSLAERAEADDNNGKCDSSVSSSRSRSVTPKISKVREDAEDADEPVDEPDKEEICSNGKENGQEGELKSDEDSKTADMEPLMLDAEEDPELMFPEEESGSDLDVSDKGSPVLSRSVTRRSHTRNIPTPKTPKSMNEQNGSETEQICVVKVVNMNPIISVERLPESVTQTPVETETESEENAEQTSVDAIINLDDDLELQEIITVSVGVEDETKNEPNITLDSCVSASETENFSLLVNITGDDATRNIEFSCKDPSLLDESTASAQFKHRSVRSLSSRRSIRPNAEDVHRRRAFHNATKEELLDCSKSSTELHGAKRKQRSATPDAPKRYKLEPDPEKSPGFLSYISSPIVNIKNRFSRATQLPTSTPILKGYRANPLLATAEGGAGDNRESFEETHVIPERKWCAIM